MPSNFVIINANGIACDAAGSRFSALAVENGRIRAVGDAALLAPLTDAGWPVHDLGGMTLLPAFHDAHQHLGLTGQVLGGLDLSGVSCLEELFASLARCATGDATGEAPGGWIMGYSFNDQNVAEGRMPTAAELDAICPNRPILVMHPSWHLCSLNGAALRALDLPADLPGLDIGPDGPTGVVRDPGVLTHVFPAVKKLIAPSVKKAGFFAAAEACLRQGAVTVHCLEGGDFGPGEAELLLECKGELPINAVLWNQTMDVAAVKRMNLSRIGGCICADGAIDAYTAALFEPYLDQPGNCGVLNYSQAQMDAFILEAHCAGLQIAVHCETDRAIEQTLCAMEKAQRAHPRADCRHRIEHCEITGPGQIERMAEAGIIASMQPAFLPWLVKMDVYERMFGKERLKLLHPYRSLLDAGARLAGGSDSPVTPCSPLTGVQAAATHPVAAQRITPYEALKMFTIDAAYAGFGETERGSLEEGKIADMVVLDGDPLDCPPEAIGGIRVKRTYASGKPVDFSRDGP